MKKHRINKSTANFSDYLEKVKNDISKRMDEMRRANKDRTKSLFDNVTKIVNDFNTNYPDTTPKRKDSLNPSKNKRKRYKHRSRNTPKPIRERRLINNAKNKKINKANKLTQVISTPPIAEPTLTRNEQRLLDLSKRIEESISKNKDYKVDIRTIRDHNPPPSMNPTKFDNPITPKKSKLKPLLGLGALGILAGGSYLGHRYLKNKNNKKR